MGSNSYSFINICRIVACTVCIWGGAAIAGELRDYSFPSERQYYEQKKVPEKLYEDSTADLNSKKLKKFRYDVQQLSIVQIQKLEKIYRQEQQTALKSRQWSTYEFYDELIDILIGELQSRGVKP